MKNKTPLLLMELVIMLLVFSLAAAVCLQGFAWADRTSREERAQDEAWLQLQNAAELLKHCRGDYVQAEQTFGGTWDGSRWTVGFDKAWNLVEIPVYMLEAVPQTQKTALLGGAVLQITDADGKVLAQTTVCWQEVAP